MCEIVPPDDHAVELVVSTALGVEFVAVATACNSKVVAVGFFTV